MEINHQVKNLSIGKFRLQYHEYEEYGVMGVGKDRKPYINMDPYIDHSMDDEIHQEMCMGLSMIKCYDIGRCNSGLPPPEVEKYSGNDCLAITLSRLNEIDPTGVHRRNIETIANSLDKEEEIHQAVYKYCYFALGSVIPWFFVLYLKYSPFYEKTKDDGVFTDNAKHFPKLLKYIDSLPFRHVGRIKIFTTYPNTSVMIHRDGPVRLHKDHNINLFFSGGRPAFVYDERKKEKIYLEKGCKSYFFNNRDFHGVDSEPVFRYTVRVDGVFSPEMEKKLGLVDGFTWCSDYMEKNDG
jgi:hypothetical protein